MRGRHAGSGRRGSYQSGKTPIRPFPTRSFLRLLAPRDMFVDALPAFLGFRLPNVFMRLVFRFVPFMRDAVAHENDKDLAAVGILVGAVQFVPAEDVVAGAQVLAGYAHAA